MSLKSKATISIAALVTSSIIFPTKALAAACTPEITTNGSYTVVAFKSVGTCTWSTPAGLTTFKGLIIGGGGGGGSAMGGGGGGGGYLEFDSLTATSDVFSITVGDGGIAGTSSSGGPPGVSGENSVIVGSGINLISRGGAGGASYYGGGHPARSNGGSGGGAAGYYSSTSVNSSGTQTSQVQTPSLSSIGGAQFGFDGSAAGTTWYPGGGGGAGASGTNSPANGGAGRSNAILGTNYFWSGGGGGSGYSNNGGTGGTGGGGGGGTVSGVAGYAGTGGLNVSTQAAYTGTAGAANTGGGGGAGSWAYLGAKGGSGIVVLSYLTFIGNTTISLQLSVGGSAATYRTTSTIEAVVGTAGKVTFYQFGKPITGCRNKSTSGSAPNIKATCSWKPSNRGTVALSAEIKPTSGSYATTKSGVFGVSVANRTSPR